MAAVTPVFAIAAKLFHRRSVSAQAIVGNPAISALLPFNTSGCRTQKICRSGDPSYRFAVCWAETNWGSPFVSIPTALVVVTLVLSVCRT
jgi:hypothetical protein